MSKFKIGDKVECVDVDTFGYEYISLGSIYEIKDIDSGYIFIKNGNTHDCWYKSQCFKLKEMKENLEKNKFNIGASDHGAYCYYDNGKTHYLQKDGTIEPSYNGDFFPNFTEAAKFLDQWLAKEFRPKLSRARVAAYMGVSEDFELID